MSLEVGALPGNIRTATIVLRVDALAPGASGLATVSLAGVQFNEVEIPAVFSLVHLHVARMDDLRVELCAAGDSIESWPRWTSRREVTFWVTNTGSAAIQARDVELMLSGFSPSVVPKAGKFVRQNALLVANSNGAPVSATDKIGLSLLCRWQPQHIPHSSTPQIPPLPPTPPLPPLSLAPLSLAPSALVVRGDRVLSAADVAPPLRAIRGSPASPFTLKLPNVAFVTWLVNQTKQTAIIDSPGKTADIHLTPREANLFFHVPGNIQKSTFSVFLQTENGAFLTTENGLRLSFEAPQPVFTSSRQLTTEDGAFLTTEDGLRLSLEMPPLVAPPLHLTTENGAFLTTENGLRFVAEPITT